MKKRLIAETGLAGMSHVEQIKLQDLGTLLSNSRLTTNRINEAPPTKYDSKDKALKILKGGYTKLPGIYKEVFLDPIKNLLNTQTYETILKTLDSFDNSTGHGPWHDWLASINQRILNFQVDATRAFEEALADLFDGFLSMEEGKRIKPPDYETVSPLAVWGSSKEGPYTWPSDIGISIGMKMATVNLPPAFSKNIALWSSVGHETGGHDILHAYKGMLDEVGTKVASKILARKNDPVLRGAFAIVNGKKEKFAEYAAKYWKDRIDETASDVCGLLNIGPAAGISLAVLLITLHKGTLLTVNSFDNVHPIDALRIFLAADVIRNTKELNVNISNMWANYFESIVEKYVENNKGFYLFSQTLDGKLHVDVEMPYNQMRETVKIVSETITNSELYTLGNHALSEVNTWANTDEILTTRIANHLLAGKEPSVEPGPDGQKVYAAHILAGATIALAKLGDIRTTTRLSIKSLNKLYSQNPVWRGLPIRFRSQLSKHTLVPTFEPGPSKKILVPQARK
ncbi:MAG TPA: hypothetical protein VH500_09145 [Nitrososphaeraceae archaeon]